MVLWCFWFGFVCSRCRANRRPDPGTYGASPGITRGAENWMQKNFGASAARERA
jgi:hypothetical protein